MPDTLAPELFARDASNFLPPLHILIKYTSPPGTTQYLSRNLRSTTACSREGRYTGALDGRDDERNCGKRGRFDEGNLAFKFALPLGLALISWCLCSGDGLLFRGVWDSGAGF